MGVVVVTANMNAIKTDGKIPHGGRIPYTSRAFISDYSI
jgi:hypothetical protein